MSAHQVFSAMSLNANEYKCWTAMLMMWGCSGWKQKFTHDGSLSAVIWFWYAPTFLQHKPTLRLPLAEVNLSSHRHSPLVKERTAERRVALGHKQTKGRGANIPTSWRRLTQAQMYLTNSPLLCMLKCEPDGGEQWGLATCLGVCSLQTGNAGADKSGGACSLQKGPKSPCHSLRYSDLILSSSVSCPRIEGH